PIAVARIQVPCCAACLESSAGQQDEKREDENSVAQDEGVFVRGEIVNVSSPGSPFSEICFERQDISSFKTK
ncbi:MAG: hypothetical protein QOE73_639, partial [Verrucomicrobiota bacterium]